ncbi:MAG: hypothetical protein P4L81_05555 [Candidatus Pacebacteria bacterium]|nr:hypothetical protein [Candidatus Paceibacterota bacterium]
MLKRLLFDPTKTRYGNWEQGLLRESADLGMLVAVILSNTPLARQIK